MATPDAAFFVERVYPLQDRVLAVVTALGSRLYLTSGTAASRGYLQHRFSDDLDLFTNDDPRFVLWADRAIQALLAKPGWRVEVSLREERFVRLTLTAGDLALKVEMVNDVPSRVGEVGCHPVLGRLDTADNILASKLTALADRQEPKDLADAWGFCCHLGLSIERALADAHGKAAGLFPPDLARVLLSATEDDWRVVRWITAPDVDAYLADLRRLGEALLLVG